MVAPNGDYRERRDSESGGNVSEAVNVKVSSETIAKIGTMLPDGSHHVLIVLSGTKATIGSNIEDSRVAKNMALEVLNTSWADED